MFCLRYSPKRFEGRHTGDDVRRHQPKSYGFARFNTWFDRKCSESCIERDLAADRKLCCFNDVLANLTSYAFENTRRSGHPVFSSGATSGWCTRMNRMRLVAFAVMHEETRFVIVRVDVNVNAPV